MIGTDGEGDGEGRAWAILVRLTSARVLADSRARRASNGDRRRGRVGLIVRARLLRRGMSPPPSTVEAVRVLATLKYSWLPSMIRIETSGLSDLTRLSGSTNRGSIFLAARSNERSTSRTARTMPTGNS